MKKSFSKYLFIFLILFTSPVFVFSQSPNPELPDEQSEAGDSLLPGKDEINPSAPSELDSVDFGTEPPAQKETFPTGSGYTENNGTATQPPIPPGSKNDSFPTGSGSTYGTGALLKVPTPPKQPTPTSVSIIDSLVSSKLFGDEPLDKLLNQLFYIGLIAAVILAIVMIIRGGLEYMTIDAITSKENGKNRVKAALGGLLLAFSAILILNTINPGLTKLNLKFEELKLIKSNEIEGLTLGKENTPTAVSGWTKDENGNFIKKQSDGSTLVNTPDGKNYTLYPDGSVRVGLISPSGGTVPVLGGQDEQSVRDYFSKNGISINNVPGITNVAGLGEAAMIGVVNLKNSSGAEIVITGGTEPGHKTHGEGKAIVDLRKNSTLDSYITTNATTNYQRGSWTEYKMSDGSTYMDEGDHWHVEYGK